MELTRITILLDTDPERRALPGKTTEPKRGALSDGTARPRMIAVNRRNDLLLSIQRSHKKGFNFGVFVFPCPVKCVPVSILAMPEVGTMFDQPTG